MIRFQLPEANIVISIKFTLYPDLVINYNTIKMKNSSNELEAISKVLCVRRGELGTEL